MVSGVLLCVGSRAAIASCESLGLPVSIPVGLESLHDTNGPASTVLLQDLSSLPSQPPVRPTPSVLPLWASREELTDSKRSAVAAIMHQRRQACKARTLALGAAYSLAIDNWDAKVQCLLACLRSLICSPCYSPCPSCVLCLLLL